MYRFLLTPRWLAVSVLALLAVPFCVFMGSWQLGRFESRVQQHKDAEHHQSRVASAAPVPLSAVLPDTRAQVSGDDSGRVVSATGRYDTGHQFLVPGRTLDDRNGFYVLTPLRLAGGALPVVRGWLPGDASAAQHAGSVPAAPAGQITVTGAMQYPETSETSGVRTGAQPSGQLGMISSASLVNILPYAVYNGWITATSPVPPLLAVPPAAPQAAGLDIKEFQNLGYTGEWFVFAGFVVFMWFRLVRREGEARADAALGLVPDARAEQDSGAAEPGAGEPDTEPERRGPGQPGPEQQGHESQSPEPRGPGHRGPGDADAQAAEEPARPAR